MRLTLKKSLTKVGITEKQANVYLACLKLGCATAPEIAQRSEIKRVSVYGVLDELVNRGLVSYNMKGRSKIFQAQNPKIILKLADENKNIISNILPQIESIFATHNLKPRFQFFESAEGIKRIYEDALQCRSKKILHITKVKDFIDFPGKKFTKEYIIEKAKKGIISYTLFPKSGDIYNDIYGRKSKKWKREVRYLPPNIFYTSMVMIYDNKVAFISAKEENFGFIIESKNISNTLRAYFEFMWNMGSKEPEENC